MDWKIRRRYKKCEICGTLRLPKSKVFLSNFPLDPDRCRLWVKASGNPDLIDVPIEKLHELKYICGSHFTRECFNEKGNRLLKNAVPTLRISTQPLADELFKQFPLHVQSYYEKHEGESQPTYANTPSIHTTKEYIPMASTSKAPIHLTFKMKVDESLPTVNTSSTIEYIPVASSSKAPMHKTFEKRSDILADSTNVTSAHVIPVGTEMRMLHKSEKENVNTQTEEATNEDNRITIRSYKRKKSIGDNKDAGALSKREKILLKRLQNTKLTLKKLSTTLLNLDKLESETLKSIVENALINQKRKPQGKRWDLKSKISALALFKRSPKAYRYMQNLLPLPNTRTLQRILKEIPMEPGIHAEIIDILKKKGETLEPEQKDCVLLFDEMALKKRLIYNEALDKVEGFVDLGIKMGRSNKISGHVLLFMIQGIKIKFKQPISHYFVEGTIESEKLAVIIKESIKIIAEANFKVIATVCDQGPTNIGALNFLKRSEGLSVDENYFNMEGKQIFIIFDIPHLFKSIRNNFYQAGIMTYKGKTAKWSHLKEAEERNKNFLNFKNITPAVVNPTYKIKMRVKYAAHALSNTMKAVLKIMALSWNSDRATEIFETAFIVEELDKLFDCTNGPASHSDVKKGIRENVSENTNHVELWNYFLKHIDSVSFLKSDSHLMLKNVRCIKGFKITLNSLKDIWNYVSKKSNFKYLNLRQLNQDALENLFGIIRQHCGTNRNPTCSHFNAALKSTIVSGLTGPHSRGSNCLMDANKVLITYKDIFKPNNILREANQNAEDGDYPVLSLPDEVELGDLEKQLDTFEEQPTVYVSGYLAAKVLKKMNCKFCKESLIEMNPDQADPLYTYIKLKEFWPDKTSLHYPKKELCLMLSEAKNIYEVEIAPDLHNINIGQWCSLQLSTKLNMNWFKCSAHHHNVKEFLFLFISKLFIRKSCKIINNTFVTAENVTADKVKKAQQANTDK